MAEWMLRRLTDYWDQQLGASFIESAVFRLSRKLEGLSESERKKSERQLADAIIRHVDALADEHVVMAAHIFADDMYKTVTSLDQWDPAIAHYLSAMGNSFGDRLASRGYALQSVIDNTFENTAVGMAGPLEWFPRWFRTAGIVYVCPQHVAARLLRKDGRPEGAVHDELDRYIREAREVAHRAVKHCQAEGAHFVYLDTNGTNHSFEIPLSRAGEPGAIVTFRRDPPVEGTKMAVWAPEGPYPEPTQESS